MLSHNVDGSLLLYSTFVSKRHVFLVMAVPVLMDGVMDQTAVLRKPAVTNAKQKHVLLTKVGGQEAAREAVLTARSVVHSTMKNVKADRRISV